MKMLAVKNVGGGGEIQTKGPTVKSSLDVMDMMFFYAVKKWHRYSNHWLVYFNVPTGGVKANKKKKKPLKVCSSQGREVLSG